MSDCGSVGNPICSCGLFVHPRVITNPPGLATIAYRGGDYTSFRHALLLARPGETQLTRTIATDQVQSIWRPTAQGDLAVQMIEWWAYLCDVLTFYNERVANESYLGTADLPESVSRLVTLLGYRPRPGIGATGLLAALTTGVKPVNLPAAFQLQSKPGPGQQPQVFELGAAVTLTPAIGAAGTSAVQGAAAIANPTQPPQLAAGSVLLKGVVSTITSDDELLLLHNQWLGADRDYAVVKVTSVSPEKDPDGNTHTRVLFTIPNGAGLPSDASPANYRLLRSGQSTHLYPYVSATTIARGEETVDLASIARQIQVGDPILFADPRPNASNSPQLVSVTAYTEVIYYANNPSDPSQPPSQPSFSYSGAPLQPGIPIPHTQLMFSPGLDSTWDKTAVQLLYAWKEVGQLMDTPATMVGGSGASNGSTLTLRPGSSFPAGVTNVLVQDANGNGVAGTVSGLTVQLDASVPHPAPLVPPLQALFNLLAVTRGKTLASEVLGSGNALVAGQDFVLQKSPVTYLQDPKSITGDDYSSTVRVWVNQLQWSEVRSLYGQPPGARVFVTREDEQGNTHVVFGDGQNGSRLPTGVNNVVASYRYGSGAGVPSAGSLTVLLQPQPGLRSILNPVPVGGGADPDPPAKVRQFAPRSVLTLGRAISIDDFETVALQTPGVTRAKAALQFNPQTQRPSVTVWVGDDQSAGTAARAAFAAAADPNRQPKVVAALPKAITLNLTIVYDRRHVPQTVQDAVRAALIDPDTGLFGINVVAIGQVFYDSQIYAACLSVPGVVSVHSLQFQLAAPPSTDPIQATTTGLSSATTSAFDITPAAASHPNANSVGTCIRQRHDPGAGNYFLLADTAGQLNIGMELAT